MFEWLFDYSKVPQCILNRYDLLLRTLRHPAALRLWGIIALLLNAPVLLLQLCDVQTAHLQAAVLHHIILDFGISGFILRIGRIRLVHVSPDLNMLSILRLGQQTHRLHMRRPREHINRLHGFEAIAARGQQLHVARLRLRATANIDDF